MKPSRSARYRALLGRTLRQLEAEGVARRVASGLRWGEGPAYLPAHDIWVFSDIPNDRMLSWSGSLGLEVFRAPSNFANGNTVAADGALLTCEQGARRVTRTTVGGTYQILCSRFEGARFNSPNDVVQHRDLSVWFSDPTYGILSDMEGYKAPSEMPANRVYRFDSATETISAEVESLKMPNGLCFSPDGRILYVADSGADMGPEVPFDEQGPREVYAFRLSSNGHVTTAGHAVARASKGVPDGIRCDEEGYLWVATGLGLECFHDTRGRIGMIETPETLANLAFGGPDGCTMMLALASSAYVLAPA
jgi:gluconolactonase